jgi:hypothetical protein
MKIQVIGSVCHKCKTLAQLTEQAVADAIYQKIKP